MLVSALLVGGLALAAPEAAPPGGLPWRIADDARFRRRSRVQTGFYGVAGAALVVSAVAGEFDNAFALGEASFLVSALALTAAGLHQPTLTAHLRRTGRVPWAHRMAVAGVVPMAMIGAGAVTFSALPDLGEGEAILLGLGIVAGVFGGLALHLPPAIAVAVEAARLPDQVALVALPATDPRRQPPTPALAARWTW
jgi:hypothetical protein